MRAPGRNDAVTKETNEDPWRRTAETKGTGESPWRKDSCDKSDHLRILKKGTKHPLRYLLFLCMLRDKRDNLEPSILFYITLKTFFQGPSFACFVTAACIRIIRTVYWVSPFFPGAP